MKGRSHRLPPSKPLDDWGDGSWTVDCSCGVTFDDGEEMVSCDECGVWVHTRCARFVRGEASFACHKCKAAARRHAHHDTAEETEVAQLLIELPTKAADPGPSLPMPPLPLRRPHVPIEERVHVHGVPGGDPALFQGVSPVFSPQLWKCAGYIPKKFNFPYREFPFWDEEGGENPASKGADVLFSLSKEVVPGAPMRSVLESRPYQKGVQKQEVEKASCSGGGPSQGSAKKERNRIRVLGAHLSKRRKEEPGEGRKRARGEPDRASADIKKRGCVPLVNMNKTGFCDGRGIEAIESDIPGEKSEDRKEDMVLETKSTEDPEGTESGSQPKHILVIKASRGGLSDESSRQRSLLEMLVKVEKVDHPEPVVSQEGSDAAKESVVEEDVSKAVHGLKQSKDENHFERVLNGSSCGVVIESKNSKPAIDDLRNSYRDGEDTTVVNSAISPSSKLDKIEVKLEEGDEKDGKLHGMDHLPQHLQKSIGHSSENLQGNESDATLPSDEPKSQDAERDSEASYQTCDRITEGKASRFSEPKLHGEAVESAGSSTVQRDSLEPRHGSKYVGGPTKLGCSSPSLLTPNPRKLAVGFGKASSTSSASALSRSSVSGSYNSLATAASSTVGKAVHLTKQQRVKVTASAGKIDNATTVEHAEDIIQEVSRQPVNDDPKDSECFGSKSLHVNRASYVVSKHTLSDSKEQLLSPSPKTSENTAILSSSGELTGSSQTQKHAVPVKPVSSGACQKNDKINQPIPQSSFNVFNHSIALHPPPAVNATTTLSDEELALLLHQELNSSPRVPRVPRVRQAAGMQLATPTATSMLKRSSSSGGKDQVSVFKRKSKEDASRESSRNSRELTDETKKMARVPSSDLKHQESDDKTDGSANKDAQIKSPDTMASVKKDNPADSIEGANCCLPSSEASGQKGLSLQSSPRNVPDDVGTFTRRTLPGLIDEILSKGRRTTYEELCEAVRPHWLNLRKPNGERYAYPSHSHAVLDCLRNRNEWAHLIDRGPKTNSSKRRRKLDSDTPTVESETEEARNKAPREAEDKNVEPHREDFPKGKRKARKRRRLELRGRGVREARKRRSQDAVSDDDPAAFSHSSNDAIGGNFSEDEIQGAGQPAAGDGVPSSSSDDTD